MAQLLKDRVKVLEDLEEEHAFFFTDSIPYDEQAVGQFLRQGGVAGHLVALKEQLEALPNFETQTVETAARSLIEARRLQPKDLIHPARVAVTGRAISPPLFEVMSILGKAAVTRRLEHAAKHLTQPLPSTR